MTDKQRPSVPSRHHQKGTSQSVTRLPSKGILSKAYTCEQRQFVDLTPSSCIVGCNAGCPVKNTLYTPDEFSSRSAAAAIPVLQSPPFGAGLHATMCARHQRQSSPTNALQQMSICLQSTNGTATNITHSFHKHEMMFVLLLQWGCCSP